MRGREVRAWLNCMENRFRHEEEAEFCFLLLPTTGMFSARFRSELLISLSSCLLALSIVSGVAESTEALPSPKSDCAVLSTFLFSSKMMRNATTACCWEQSEKETLFRVSDKLHWRICSIAFAVRTDGEISMDVAGLWHRTRRRRTNRCAASSLMMLCSPSYCDNRRAAAGMWDTSIPSIQSNMRSMQSSGEKDMVCSFG